MTYTYKTKGTCSSNIELEVEDGIVKDILSGVAATAICKACPAWLPGCR